MFLAACAFKNVTVKGRKVANQRDHLAAGLLKGNLT